MTNVRNLIITARPQQWTKNVVIFAPLIFSQNLLHHEMFIKTLCGFIIFCLASSTAYIFNDILDRERDRGHPKKSQRPIASGELSVGKAARYATLFLIISLACSYTLSTNFGLFILGYFILQISYSLKLKDLIILDIFAVAAGFVLRVMAGAALISVPISSWLLICTLLLALFLALCKRRHELVLLNTNAAIHRPALREYSPYLLDQMIAVVTASTLIAYILYTLSPETIEKFHTDSLKYTTPFVLFGIFRYLYLVHQKEQGGNPEKVLLTDIPLILDILLYGLSVWLIIY